MISEQNIGLWAEKYLSNDLNPSELEMLNNSLKSNEALKSSWEETLFLLRELEKKGQYDKMHQSIRDVALKHTNIIGQEHIQAKGKERMSLPLFAKNNYWKMTGIAAALVILSTLTTLWVVKNNANSTGIQYTLLRREIENIKHSQSQMIDSIGKLSPQKPLYGGTGFALTIDGYVGTNYHVVKDAHSIYIQTADKRTYKAYIVAFEPKEDVAILKIEDSNFRFQGKALPYSLSKNVSDLGQRVFTIGYPQDDLVYNEGYISCERGFNDDSSSYQLEMVANPGQSGAPVLDQYGNIIALITGKRSNTSGTTYAVHTDALWQLIQSLPEGYSSNLLLPTKSQINHLSRINQVGKLRPYICAVKVN